MNTRKLYTAFPGTLPAHRARPLPAPAPSVRVHRVTASGTLTTIEVKRDPMPTVRGPQERRDATTLNEYFRKVGGMPTRSKATLCP